jgi:hypothetical protein
MLSNLPSAMLQYCWFIRSRRRLLSYRSHSDSLEWHKATLTRLKAISVFACWAGRRRSILVYAKANIVMLLLGIVTDVMKNKASLSVCLVGVSEGVRFVAGANII